MEDRKTVIFLEYFEVLEDAIPLIRRIRAGLKSDPVIVSSNFDTSALAKYTDLKVLYFDNLLSRQDYEDMDRFTDELTQSWYSNLTAAEGITEYKGIRFGEISEEKAQAFFTSTIKNLEIILKIAKELHPDKIILIGEKDVFSGFPAFIKEELGIQAEFIKRRTEKKSYINIGNIPKIFIAEIFARLCDYVMRKRVIRKKREGGIFIDTRLYFELRDIGKEFYPYLYLIEKGLRIRWKLFWKERFLFTPIFMDAPFRRLNIISHFRRFWRCIEKDTEFREKFIYKDLKIWKILKENIRDLIVYDFSLAKENTLFLERIFNALKPRLIILREAVRSAERTILFSARLLRIPSLVIQHGNLSAWNIWTKLLADKIALWGKAGIDWYKKYGNDPSKCVVTGKPSHDSIHSDMDRHREKLKRQLLKIGADPAKETILCISALFKDIKKVFFVYLYRDSEFMILDKILKIAKNLPDKQFIIKVHPFDLVDINRFIYPRIKGYPNVFIMKDADILSLIKHSTLVISSMFSSAALDAVILGKPLITLNFFKRDDLVPFAQRGVAVGVDSPEDLQQTVIKILKDQKLRDYFASNREDFVHDYAYKIDGKSTGRVIDLVKKSVLKNQSM